MKAIEAIEVLVRSVTGKSPVHVGGERRGFEGRRWSTWALLRHVADIMEHG